MEQASKIAELNDRLRCHHIGGRVMITQGIQVLDQNAIAEIIAAVSAFSDFTPDNDPWGEHDCAAMDVGEHRIIFKIDAYDREMTFASPDPADPAVTLRVLTIMLADEY
ncbi:DUF3768 domain-containing protein [Magnetospirillum sp. 15-1]|uniref:DUF3768 domain-containing protein n=1 Tax=Magnetospirillum sp. 15-1 TaxID=1979370 RepID=UPI000BBBA6BF|nr:DUF3768 domain-containing protein [Magnetospirillum sp. 15-1]